MNRPGRRRESLIVNAWSEGGMVKNAKDGLGRLGS
jgi:hypothetical protein